MSYAVRFTDLAKAAAEKSSSLAAVEAEARACIDAELWIGPPVCEMTELPNGGFYAFQMPDGQEYIAWFYGDDGAEIDVVERHESLGRIEDKVDWLGLTGDVLVPVRRRR